MKNEIMSCMFSQKVNATISRLIKDSRVSGDANPKDVKASCFIITQENHFHIGFWQNIIYKEKQSFWVEI